jgi:hypothetical protein
LIWLVQVPEPEQPVPLRSHVSNLHGNFVANLLLNVEVVVLHVRCPDVPVNREYVALFGDAIV